MKKILFILLFAPLFLFGQINPETRPEINPNDTLNVYVIHNGAIYKIGLDSFKNWVNNAFTESQTLSFVDPNISISGGNSIDISSIDTDTQLSQEQVEDHAGGLFNTNSETRITSTYNDGTGKVDLIVEPNLSNYTNDAGFLTSEVDGSTSNETETASNVGSGEGIFKQKTGLDLEFKTLSAGSNMTITPTGDSLVFASSGGGGDGSFLYFNTVSDLESAATTYDSTTVAFVEETKAEYVYAPSDASTGDAISGFGIIKQTGKAGVWIQKEMKNSAEWLVLILMGQSNMVGRADTSTTVTETTDSRIYQMTRSGYSIVEATQPLDHWDEVAGSYGMGIDIANGMLDNIGANQKILIIPAAKGSTEIDQHMKGDATGYYTDLVERLNRVFAVPNFKPLAICWHQGESDTDDQDEVDTYEGKFNLLFFQLKQDVPELQFTPIIVGGMNPAWLEGDATGRFVGIDNVLRNLETNLRHHNVYFVTAKGCYELKDNIHFARSSLGRFAERFSSVVQQKTFGDGQLPEKPILRVHQTATDAGQLEWENIYSPVPLTGINVYIGGVLNSTISNAIDATTDSTYTVSSITISGVNITMSAVNENGEGPQSDAFNVTYSGTAPTPLHEYLLNETSGTTVNDSGTGGNDGTLSEDASNVTSTLDGTNCFEFDRSQTIALASDITFNPDDSYTIHFEVETDLDNSMVLGEQATGYNYFFMAPGEGVRAYWRYDNRQLSTTYLNTFHKYTFVVQDNYYRFYEDGTLQETGHVNTQFLIDTIGAGHSAASLNFDGKIKEVRIWDSALNPTQVSGI